MPHHRRRPHTSASSFCSIFMHYPPAPLICLDAARRLHILKRVKRTRPPALSDAALKALTFAEQLCASKKLRFTPIRREVLTALWELDAPTKAYDLAAYMKQRGGSQLNPPSIYRTLDFLYRNGLIHRIESLNAFAACHDNQDYHEGQFLICSTCGFVEEVHEDAVMKRFATSIGKLGYELEHQIVELKVRCLKQPCPNRPAAPATKPQK